MRARAVVAAGLVVSLAAGGAAEAAGKPKPKAKPKPVPPVCNLVKGTSGDAAFDPSSSGISTVEHALPQDPNGDILSADIASNAKYVTAVIRVKSLATPDTTFPGAHLYLLSWSVPGHNTPVYLAGTIDPNPQAGTVYGPQFVFGDTTTFAGGAIYSYTIASAVKVTGHIDAVKKTITLSAPISSLGSYGTFKPGTRFTEISAQTQATTNGPVLPMNAPAIGGSVAWGWQEDADNATKDYIAGTPSCVKPGS